MTEANPAQAVSDAIDRCLELAATWLTWDGRPVVTDGENVWTPHKALRRIIDHLIDHLAEVEALLAGAPTIPDDWRGRSVTLDSDWARFTELDLHEGGQRLRRLGQLYILRFEAAGSDAWDLPRSPNWTLRKIAEHVSNVTWYADQLGKLPR